MAKLLRTYRISQETDTLLKAEAARLSESERCRVSEADVIELAVVKWCSVDDVSTPVNTERHTIAENVLREAEAKAETPAPTIPKGRESYAQRKARETKEHAEKLAESDVTARLTGRDDIEYDLENVPHRSVIHVADPVNTKAERAHYEVQERKVKPLTRPHGSTEAKRRREQG